MAVGRREIKSELNQKFTQERTSKINAPVRGIGEQPVDGHIHFFQTLRSYWGGRMQADRWSKREKFPNEYFTFYSSQTLIETF